MDAPPLRELVPIPAVWERLERVEARLYEVTESENPFVTKIARHLLDAGGKRYRPLVAQVAAELGPDPDSAVDAGVAVELVHLGSLYHDDVIDEAAERRGASSVNINWSNTIAILAGDFLLARASEVAAPLGEEAVALLARTYATLCEGQVLELQLTDDVVHTPADYFRVIGGKTASLIRTSARLGALAAGASRDEIEAASDWAWEMGMVFQLTDDVLDLVATDEFLGKPAGSDIGEGVFTLAALHALQSSPALRELVSAGRPFPPETISRIITMVREGGYTDRAIDEATARLAVSEKAIDSIPLGPTREVLRSLGRYLLSRVEEARRQ